MVRQRPMLPPELQNIPFEQAQFDYICKMNNDISKVRKKNQILEGIVKFMMLELKVLNDWHHGETKRLGKLVYDSIDLSDLNIKDLDMDQLSEVLTEKVEKKRR